MDLRTKLVFVLVAVALASMLALGSLAYRSAEDLITQRSERSLEALAEAKAERVESVVRGWEEAVRLLASRTQLRRSLGDWNRGATDSDRARIERILTDAMGSSGLVEGLAVMDVRADLVATAGSVEPAPSSLRAAHAAAVRAAGDTHLTPVTFVGFTDDEPPRIAFSAGLSVESALEGTLLAYLSTHDLGAVAANRTGLLDTGETLIATQQLGGELRLLTPPLHEIDPAPGDTLVLHMMRVAFSNEDPESVNLHDYRDEPVMAATRRIEAANLGLLVKFDEAEERADVVELRDRIVGVGLSLAAFAILAGVGLAFAFARPINELASVARKIHGGDLSARANAAREDELGLLAETFNEMSDELERRMTVLLEFKTFFDESRDMLCIAGTNGYFKRVNPAFMKTLGWAESELLGRPFVDFVHPDDVQATIRETERLAQGLPTITFTNRYRCKDGSYMHLHWTSHPDPGTGNIYASARSGSDMLMG